MLYDRDFPELPQLIELLGGDEEDRHQAEALCREILTQRESVDVETILAAILSDQGHADEAVSMLTAVCERHPAYWQALYVRGRIRVKTGDIEAGLADSEAASQMMLSVMSEEWIEVFPFGDLDLDFFAEGVDLSHEPGILAGLVAFFIVVCFVLCIRWGLRQKREANGTWRRLLAVAAFVTSLWSIPVIAAAAMIRFEVGNPPGLFWWVFIGFFMFFVIRGTMRPPNLTYVGEDALPECDSPEMLARIDRLAKRIGVATPTVRTQRAMHHAGDSSAAFVGGLAPHSIVLYDTILSQLREDEQDGVIGHELGHIANRSIWIYVAVYPLMMVTVVVLSFLSGGAFGIVAGSAVRAGSFRLISRWFEYDCDRRAALAASPDAVARGLRRIHARHVLGKSGLLTAIVHSTATHPSLDERIHALAKMAGGDATDANQTVSVPYDAGRVALCRKLVVLFAALWLCLTSYGIAAILINGESLSPMLALSAAVFGPTFFMVLAIRKPIRIEAVRHKGKFKWTSLTFRRKVGVVSCAGVFVMAMYFGVFPDSFAPNSPEPAIIRAVVTLAMLLALLGGIIFGFTGSSPNRDARKKLKIGRLITGAAQRNDFDEVIESCKENYEVVKQDKQLRYSGAAALLAKRQLEKFVPYCEKIREEFPHFPPPALSLATVYLDQGEPAKALEAIRGIEKDLHKLDPLPAVIASRCLLVLGQLDEAQAECDRAVRLSPDDVSVIAQAARVSLARGAGDEADRLIEEGNALLPAEPLLIVARAERAMISGDRISLQTERDALAAALDGDRLLNLYSHLARFDHGLGNDSSGDA